MCKKNFIILGVICLMGAGLAGAETLSQAQVVTQALGWMHGNPVMSQANLTVASVSTFSSEGTYFVYVVELSDKGYLILNSDDRLPLTVAYSADSNVDLSDDPQNSLRKMLLAHCERMEEQLSTMSALPVAMAETVEIVEIVEAGGDELYGPFLETFWSQDDPYNLFCPECPEGYGSSQFGYRAPTGCVMTAFAQVLNYHRWPVHGTGSRSYTDQEGNTGFPFPVPNPDPETDPGEIFGDHYADFSDDYDWANMKPEHSPTDSLSEQEAVGELMYELGVSISANYERSGTAAITSSLGNRLGDHFFYEQISNSSSLEDLIAPMEADLRAGFPCVVSVPGHAIVADGLMVDDGVTTYHINYGWGGSNNGWFSASSVVGEALTKGVTSIRPMLMAFPESDEVIATNGSARLKWILPKWRENEVSKLTIMQYNQETWEPLHEDTTLASHRFSVETTEWDDCDDFTVFEETLSSDSAYWAISTSEGVPNCFYKSPPWRSNDGCHLTSYSTITPTSSTYLTVRGKYKLRTQEYLKILVSTDRRTFTELWSGTGAVMQWTDIRVDLSAYAGQDIYVRLLYELNNSYYQYGGIWIDSISTQEFTHLELEGQPMHYTDLSGLSPGTYTLAAVLSDSDAVEHELGPSFTLTVPAPSNDSDDDGDGLPDSWEQQYYGDETNAVPSAMAANGVNTVMDCYIAGLDPTNSQSFFDATLADDADDADGCVLHWNAVPGRSYSIWSTENLADGFPTLEANVLSPQSSWTDPEECDQKFYKVDVTIP